MDNVEAMNFYRKAAAKGNVDAQINLGDGYRAGAGVPQDEVEAVKWYRKVANQGVAEGQNKLGTCYLSGSGVTQDIVEACAYYSLAARTISSAADYLASVEATLTEAQKLKIKQRAAELQNEIETKEAGK